MPSNNRPNNFDYSKKSNEEILKIFNANSTSDNERIKTLHEKAKSLLNKVESIFNYFQSIDDIIKVKRNTIKNKKSGLSIFSKLKGKDKEEVDTLSKDIENLKNIDDVLKKFMYNEKNKKVKDFKECYLYVKILKWDKEVYSENKKAGAIVFNKPFKSSHKKLFDLKLTNNGSKNLIGLVNELRNVYSIIDRKDNSDNDFKEIAAKKFNNLFDIVSGVYYSPSKFGAFDDLVKNGIDKKKWDQIIDDDGNKKEMTDGDKKNLVGIYVRTTLIGEELFKFFQKEQNAIKKHKNLRSIVLSLQCIAFIVTKLSIENNADFDWVEKIFGVPENHQYYQNINNNFKSLDPNTRWNQFKNMLTNTFADRTKDEIEMKKKMEEIYTDAQKFMKPLKDIDLGKIVQEEDAEKLRSHGNNNEILGQSIAKFEQRFNEYCRNSKDNKGKPRKIPEGWKDRIETRLGAVKLLISEAYREFKRKIKEAQDNFLNNFGLAGNVEGFNPLDCVFYQELTSNPMVGQIGLCICINNKSDFVLKMLNGVLGKLSDINIGARIPSVKLGSLNPKRLIIRRVQPLTISLKNKLFALRNDLNVGIYVIVAGASKLLSLVFPENIAAIANGATNLVGLNVDLGTNVDVLKHKDKK